MASAARAASSLDSCAMGLLEPEAFVAPAGVCVSIGVCGTALSAAAALRWCSVSHDRSASSARKLTHASAAGSIVAGNLAPIPVAIPVCDPGMGMALAAAAVGMPRSEDGPSPSSSSSSSSPSVSHCEPCEPYPSSNSSPSNSEPSSSGPKPSPASKSSPLTMYKSEGIASAMVPSPHATRTRL